MRTHRFLLASLMAVVAVTATATAASAASKPYCGIVWGSQMKSAPDLVPGPITGARTGSHSCYDRLVIDVGSQPAPGYFAYYSDGLRQPGSGDPVAVKGGAVITINVLAPSYDQSYRPTTPWRPGDHVAKPSSKTFCDVVYAGSFEGETTIGLGVRARLPFRVFKLDGPGPGSRLVIDVAHRWS